MISRRSTLKGIAAGAASLATASVFAQADRGALTVLVGAASSMDYTARLVAEKLREPLGRPVVVQSRLGAGGRLALGELRRAAPDGNTLMVSTSSPLVIFPNIFTGLDYDPDTDFTPIAGVSWFEVGIAVGPMISDQTLDGMLAWVKAQSSPAIYGSSPGNGSLSHFVGIATALATGLPMEHVPYKDSAIGVSDLVSGRIPILITGLAPLLGMHRAGRIRIVATSGTQRAAVTTDVPTLKEAGVNVANVNSVGLYGPAKLPADMVQRLHAQMGPILAQAEVQERLVKQGMTPLPIGPQELAESLRSDRALYADLVKRSGYQPEPL